MSWSTAVHASEEWKFRNVSGVSLATACSADRRIGPVPGSGLLNMRGVRMQDVCAVLLPPHLSRPAQLPENLASPSTYLNGMVSRIFHYMPVHVQTNSGAFFACTWRMQ
jgi:hypothetical protein